eukprot:1620828-Pyramimonas_sp.AAC.1
MRSFCDKALGNNILASCLRCRSSGLLCRARRAAEWELHGTGVKSTIALGSVCGVRPGNCEHFPWPSRFVENHVPERGHQPSGR